ncbi:hypothetical protein [Motilibacter deserti]|uniref:Transcriptional regulator, AbiEi antitoxin, Type IV TA system n=1 Tax=Motilibacter deserti TaxID=2714956 RepID=A0ABX0GYG3_9ACTN|nr:hypothetical protein [Motilibacter deserti]NHC14745.1 hypothetical protein [Motilibacter deserti]
MTSLNTLARDQERVVSRDQALAELTPDALKWRLRSQRWRQVHREVYCVDAGPLTPLGTAWAALLACGPASALSHRTAAWLWGLVDEPPEAVSVRVPAERRVPRLDGVRAYRSRRMDDLVHPSASPRRIRLEHTVLDLVDTSRDLAAALAVVAASVQRRLTTPARLRAAVAQRPSFRWRPHVLAVLADVAEGAHSLLEVRYLRNVERRHGLPEARRQHPTKGAGGRRYRDVEYDEFGLVVELDGQVGHTEPDDRRRDRKRDNAVVVSTRSRLRYDYVDVTFEPCDVAVEVAAVLGSRGWTGTPRPCGKLCAFWRL